jgi:hypothetical protein
MELIECKLLHNKTKKIMMRHKLLINNIHKIICVFKKRQKEIKSM